MYFWNKTPRVSGSSSVHHKEFFTVHTGMVYVIHLASRIRIEFRPDPAHKLSAKTPDGGQRNFPKHVEFYSKNKF